MKQVVLTLTMALFVLFTVNGVALAQEQQKQFSITDVEKLIDQKMNEDKPLTQEELTRALLDMKDDKISELEGNISKTISFFGLFVAITAFILAAVTGFIGWLIKRSIDDKLDKISEKEMNIIQKHSDIQTKAGTIEEYFKEVKKFRDNLEKFNNRLENISKATKESKQNFESLGQYVGTIESVTDSTILMFKFLRESNETTDIIEETREVLQLPQKNLPYVLIKLEKKLNTSWRFSAVKDITDYLDFLNKGLSEHENNLWDKFRLFNGIQTLHHNLDEDTMTFNAEVKGNYDDWRWNINKIIEIKEFWESHLSMNPVNPPTNP